MYAARYFVRIPLFGGLWLYPGVIKDLLQTGSRCSTSTTELLPVFTRRRANHRIPRAWHRVILPYNDRCPQCLGGGRDSCETPGALPRTSTAFVKTAVFFTFGCAPARLHEQQWRVVEPLYLGGGVLLRGSTGSMNRTHAGVSTLSDAARARATIVRLHASGTFGLPSVL